MINSIGWLGNVFFLLGAMFLARKWISGWWMQIFGNLCYLLFAFLMGMNGISLGALSFLLILINVDGLKKWKKPNWIRIN